MLATAERTPAGEALRTLLPDSADPYEMIQAGCHAAFLIRDRDLLPDCVELAQGDPERAAALIVTLAALVDVDARPAGMLGWLADDDGTSPETARWLAAMAEARTELEADAADALPPVTLESMRELTHAAAVAGVAPPCGTVPGWARHRRRGTPLCERCREARRLYDAATAEQREWLRRPIGLPTGRNGNPATPPCGCRRAACGTRRGHAAHVARGEHPCDSCWQAEREADAGDTLPAVTLESIRAAIHAANLAGVLQPCGTPAAWRRHRDRREHPCPRCIRAQELYNRATAEDRKLLHTPPVLVRRQPAKCGTLAGYERHRKRKEDICAACAQRRGDYDAQARPRRIAMQGGGDGNCGPGRAQAGVMSGEQPSGPGGYPGAGVSDGDGVPQRRAGGQVAGHRLVAAHGAAVHAEVDGQRGGVHEQDFAVGFPPGDPGFPPGDRVDQLALALASSHTR